jgi:hypothetical protein
MKEDTEDFSVPEELDTTPMEKPAQINLAAELQAGALRLFLRRVKSGQISDTGLNTLVRLLAANGWDLDPSHLPQELKDMLTSKLSPEEIEADDDILPLRRKA